MKTGTEKVVECNIYLEDVMDAILTIEWFNRNVETVAQCHKLWVLLDVHSSKRQKTDHRTADTVVLCP